MKQTLSLHQRLLLSPRLLTYLDVLVKPLPELAEWLELQIEENPLLVLEAPYRKFQGNKIAEIPQAVEYRDLYETLEFQAREVFENRHQLKEGLDLIQEIDERGFLPPEVKEGKVLSMLQAFDPPGIAARSICECLKLQLERKKSSKLSLDLIKHHYEDLLHYRSKKICKSLKISEKKLSSLIKKELACLSLAPADTFKKTTPIPWIPDLFVLEEENNWKVEINISLLPRVKIGLHYEIPLNDEEIKIYLKSKNKEANYVIDSIRKRNTTLLKIGNLLLKKEKKFLEGHRNRPEKMSVDDVANKLGRNQSTIYRALRNKVISTPRGIFSLDAFFLHGGSASSMIEEKIQQLIFSEDRNHPFSDSFIAQQLQQLGFACCTRTVTKYRNSLLLPKARLRKI